MKLLFVHDWLTGMRGGERVLEVLLDLYPQSPIYTLFHVPGSVSAQIEKNIAGVSPLGKLPGVRKYYRELLPFFPYASRRLGRMIEERLAREHFDAVVSISHCAAKNVLSEVNLPPHVKHYCYCLTPMRYIWDQYDAYFGGKTLEPLIRQVAKNLRVWDVHGATTVDRFAGISNFVCSRILNVYGEPAETIYPPVRTSWIAPRNKAEHGEGFLCVNALVPYKNVDVIIETFNRNGLPLTIVGRGPESRQLRRLAKANIRIIDFLSDSDLASLYRNSRAMIFAAEEDFGMTPVEMQAAGRPVIALGRGGSCETVVNGRTGVFFSEPTPEKIQEALDFYLDHEHEFTVENCITQAELFSFERFSAYFSRSLAALVEGSVCRRQG